MLLGVGTNVSDITTVSNSNISVTNSLRPTTGVSSSIVNSVEASAEMIPAGL